MTTPERFHVELERRLVSLEPELVSLGVETSHVARVLDHVGAVAYDGDDTRYVEAATAALQEAFQPLIAELDAKRRAMEAEMTRRNIETNAHISKQLRVWEAFHRLQTSTTVH